MQDIARRGKGHVSEVAYSPDGELLAVGTSNGVYLVDAQTLSEVRLLNTNNWVSSIAFSPDGEQLAVNNDQTIQLWRVRDGQLLSTLEGHTSNVTSVSFSPDGRLLASGSADGTVRLWGVVDASP